MARALPSGRSRLHESHKRRSRPTLTILEDRTAPAVTAFTGGELRIALDDMGETVELSNAGSNITVTSTSGVTGDATFAASAVKRIVVTDPSQSTGQMLIVSGPRAYALSRGLLSRGVENVTVLGAVNASGGNAEIRIDAANALDIRGSLIAGRGGIQLTAQGRGTMPAHGITVTGRIATTANGTIRLTGTGSDLFVPSSFLFWKGVSVTSGGVVEADGAVTIIGSGGAGGDGVSVSGSGSKITSAAGSVRLQGTGGRLASAPTYQAPGVTVLNGGKILGRASQTVQITSTGVNVEGNGSGIFSETGNILVLGSNNGVYVEDRGTIASQGGNVVVNCDGRNYSGVVVSRKGTIQSEFGNVSVTGGVSRLVLDGHGVLVQEGGRISAGGAGSVTVIGTGPENLQGFSTGVKVEGRESEITSKNGSIFISGIGGRSTSGSFNHGVWIIEGRIVSRGGTGNVLVTGKGGTGAGSCHYGVEVGGMGAAIGAERGNVTVIGKGGGSGPSGINVGVFVKDDGQITAGGRGTVRVTGIGGASGGVSHAGVRVLGNEAKIRSANGNVFVTGTGGSRGLGGSSGVHVLNGGSIESDGTGTVRVSGTGGVNKGARNHGVHIGASSVIGSAKGNVIVTGTGGTSAAGQHAGVVLDDSGMILAGGAGNVMVTGTSKVKGTDVVLFGSATIGTADNAPVTINANRLQLEGFLYAGSGTVTIRPRSVGVAIELGDSGSPTSLWLTDKELDRINARNLIIGSRTSGPIAITSPITRKTTTDLSLQTRSVIRGAATGTDLDLAGGTLRFGPGGMLIADINGADGDIGYDPLRVRGTVDLTGLEVSVSGSHVPESGAIFPLVEATQVRGRFSTTDALLNGVRLNLTANSMAGIATALPPLQPVVTSAGGSRVKLLEPEGQRETEVFPGFTGEVRTASADFNGDGVAELVAAAGPGGASHVVVIDSATGERLLSIFAYGEGFTGGVFVAACDVNGDGVPDIITGAGAGGGPHVKVFDGVTEAELLSFMAFDSEFLGGVSVAAGDFDGDGIPDLIVGAASNGSPHVKAFRLDTRDLLTSFMAFEEEFTGGVFVAAGDLTGDGRAEIAVGSGEGRKPTVRVFGRDTRAAEREWEAYAPEFLGGVRVGMKDVIGNGRVELLTGAGRGGAGHVRVFDATGDEVRGFLATDPSGLSGVFVG